MKNKSAHTRTTTEMPTIEWPKEWASDEGFPTRDSGVVSTDRRRRTWADFDDALKEQGTSLAELVEQMGGNATTDANGGDQ